VKRSSALAPLSRDHHVALEAALALRRADAAGVGAAGDRFAAFWEPRGRRHFAIEERLLLPALPTSDAEWADASARVLDDHERIRRLADDLASARGGERVAVARRLGELLHDHVRFEERHLFSLLERRLDEDALRRLGQEIEEAETDS
jgi:hypothetical protein